MSPRPSICLRRAAALAAATSLVAVGGALPAIAAPGDAEATGCP